MESWPKSPTAASAVLPAAVVAMHSDPWNRVE